MRKFCLILVLLISVIAPGQQPDSNPKGKTDRRIITNDSMMKALQKQTDSIIEAKQKQAEMKEFQETNQRNLDSFLQSQKERRAKEKRNAMMRIGFGVLLLIVLFVGLRRRRSNSQTGK